MDKFDCNSCSFTNSDFREFSKHLRRHAGDPYFIQNCSECDNVFKSYRSWQRHVSVHIARREDTSHQSRYTGTTPSYSESCSAQTDGEEQYPDNPEDAEPSGAESIAPVSEEHVADFLITLRGRGIPMNVCMQIVSEMKKLGKRVVHECEEMLSKKEHTEAGDAADIGNLADEIASLKMLDAVDSSHKLFKFAKSERDYVPPVSVELDKANHFQYVPIKAQLSSVLGDKKVADQLRFRNTSTPGTYADICDGKNHKNMEERIQLIMYFDEFVVTNPLGNKVNKYSVGAIYFVVANLERRAQLKDMHLCMLFRADLTKKFGWEKVLAPLLSDLKLLEEDGIQVSFSCGEKKEVTCSLEMIVGDNKGVHDIAGFFKTFVNTKRICRTCHAETDDIQSKMNVSDYAVRTVQGYEDEVGILEREEFDEEMQKIFGVHRRCELNQLTTFHCITGLPLDISHDVFEDGVAKHAVEQVLQALIGAQLLDLDEVNTAISSLKYHRVDGNKPQRCQKKGAGISCKQTCAEMWTLLRLLPLMLSTSIRPSSLAGSLKAIWDILTGLISIVQILMASVILDKDVDMVEKLVEKWLKAFCKCFPNFRMKPKMHFLLHYANCIREHGPPFRYSAIRFEAKHSELKRYMKNSTNHKNVCRSMAVSCQLSKCTSKDPTSNKHDEDSKEYVSESGYRYITGDVVVQKSDTDENDRYLKVTNFSKDDDGTCSVMGVAIEDVRYVEELCAFTVRLGGHAKVPVSKLASLHPLGLYNIFGQDYVVPVTSNHYIRKE